MAADGGVAGAGEELAKNVNLTVNNIRGYKEDNSNFALEKENTSDDGESPPDSHFLLKENRRAAA